MVNTNLKWMKKKEKRKNKSDVGDELCRHQPHMMPIKKEDITLFSLTRWKWYLDYWEALHTLFIKHWCLPHPPTTFYFFFNLYFYANIKLPLSWPNYNKINYCENIKKSLETSFNFFTFKGILIVHYAFYFLIIFYIYENTKFFLSRMTNKKKSLWKF